MDLLIGGSPCQGFSFAGKQLAFDDPRSKLFFVYLDILSHIRELNPDVKFMLENVRMKAEHLDVITEALGVEPVLINSSLVSAQNRKRFYWANWKINQPDDRLILASSYEGQVQDMSRPLRREFFPKKSRGVLDLVGYYGGNSTSQRVYGTSSKMPTLLTNNTGGNNPLWVSEDGLTAFRASIGFCEFLQTVPKDYTRAAPLDQRYRMLGNGWTVDLVCEIFKGLVGGKVNDIMPSATPSPAIPHTQEQ